MPPTPWIPACLRFLLRRNAGKTECGWARLDYDALMRAVRARKRATVTQVPLDNIVWGGMLGGCD